MDSILYFGCGSIKYHHIVYICVVFYIVVYFFKLVGLITMRIIYISNYTPKIEVR